MLNRLVHRARTKALQAAGGVESMIANAVLLYADVSCGSHCRTMTKRGAEKYLTDQNWDKEEPDEEVED